jgi:hypothetical protein
MSDKDLFGMVTWAHDELVARGIAEPEKPRPRERRPEEGPVLDYGSTRPEITDTYLSDGPLPTRPAPMDRPPTPMGSEPTLEYPTRPELAGPGLVETMRRRNGRTLAELRAAYLSDLADYRNHKRPDRPYFCPQGAIDFSEALKGDPNAGAVPASDLVGEQPPRM